MRLDVLFRCAGFGFQDHDGVDLFPPFFRRDADDCAGQHGGVLADGIFDFGGIDVFTARDDHVLDPVHQEDEAVFVHVTGIAGHDPAVFLGRRRHIGFVPVAQHGDRALDGDFADRAARQFLIVLVAHFDFDHAGGPPAGAQPVRSGAVRGMIFGRKHRGDGREFGLPEGLQESHAGESVKGAAQGGLCDRGGAIGNEPQRRGVPFGQIGTVEHHLDHHRDQQDMGGPVLFDRGQRGFGRKHGNGDVGAADKGHGGNPEDIRNMEHRRGMEIDRTIAQFQFLGIGDAADIEVGVAEHHALGKAGSAAGIEDTGQIVTGAARVRHRVGGVQDVFVVVHALGRVAVSGKDDCAQARHLGADRGGGGSEGIVNNQDFRARIVQRIGAFGRGPADVHRHHRAAGPDRGKEILDETVRVERQERDPVPRFHTECLKRPGQFLHPFEKLQPVVAALSENRGDTFGVDLRGAAQDRGNLHGWSSHRIGAGCLSARI